MRSVAALLLVGFVGLGALAAPAYADRPTAEALKKKGDAALAAGKSGDALTFYEQAIDADPELFAAYEAAAPLWFAAKDYDRASKRLRAAVTLDPKFAMGWYHLAFALRKKGELGSAVEAYKKFIELRPGEPDAWYGLGLTYKAMGKKAEAREALGKYIELEKRPERASYVEKARAELEEIEEPAAPAPAPAPAKPPAPAPVPVTPPAPAPVTPPAPAPAKPPAPAPVTPPAPAPAAAPKAGVLTPFPAPTADAAAEATRWLEKGDASFKAKRYDEAAGSYRGAVAADPSSAEARYKLGVALAAAGDLPGAIAAWEGVLLVAPAHEQARRNIELARARLARSAPEPVDEVAVLQKARALVDDGRFASAILLLDGFLADPARATSVAALALRAEAHLGAGDAQAAVVDWMRVLALDPRHRSARAGLAAAYTALGDTPRATYWGTVFEDSKSRP
jgi:tetratricopeptide (TPR) repeat protein